MKRILRIVLVICLVNLDGIAQDIPLFSQKLTNSFIYNPSLAGHTYGSLTYAYRQNYSNVAGAPKNHFLSMHTPFANHKMGVGINVFQEDVNFIRNTYASIAGAYHLHFNRYNILSVGVSGEYNLSRVNGTSNTISVEPDPVLNQLQNGDPTYDFSFGVNYQTRHLKTGFALNRLATSWLNKETANLTNYFSGYIQGLIPMRGGDDLLEPYVAFRRFSETNETYDIGLFYTYDAKIMGGLAMRKGNVINGTVGFKFFKHVMVGYSREIIGSSLGGYVGAANEITLRLDFNDETYKERFRADYKNAMAFRRKTLNAPSNPLTHSSRHLKNTQKRLTPYSPNNRYQDVKKLSVKKKTSAPIKKFNARKVKPTGKQKQLTRSPFRKNKYNPVLKNK
jgi:type IX secretion system PorP/SprF family membrane protein